MSYQVHALRIPAVITTVDLPQDRADQPDRVRPRVYRRHGREGRPATQCSTYYAVLIVCGVTLLVFALQRRVPRRSLAESMDQSADRRRAEVTGSCVELRLDRVEVAYGVAMVLRHIATPGAVGARAFSRAWSEQTGSRSRPGSC